MDGRRHSFSEGAGQELTETRKVPSSQRGRQQEKGPITACVGGGGRGGEGWEDKRELWETCLSRVTVLETTV